MTDKSSTVLPRLNDNNTVRTTAREIHAIDSEEVQPKKGFSRWIFNHESRLRTRNSLLPLPQRKSVTSGCSNFQWLFEEDTCERDSKVFALGAGRRGEGRGRDLQNGQ